MGVFEPPQSPEGHEPEFYKDLWYTFYIGTIASMFWQSFGKYNGWIESCALKCHFLDFWDKMVLFGKNIEIFFTNKQKPKQKQKNEVAESPVFNTSPTLCFRGWAVAFFLFHKITTPRFCVWCKQNLRWKREQQRQHTKPWCCHFARKKKRMLLPLCFLSCPKSKGSCSNTGILWVSVPR